MSSRTPKMSAKSAYAESFQAVSARFVAAHEMFVKSLPTDAGPPVLADPGDATATP